MNSGIGFIIHENGWACSDDVLFDVESDPVPGADNKINLVKTNTLKFSAIFDGVGKVVKGLKVFCLFKSGDRKTAFTGQVRGKSGDLTVVELFAKSERINELISKIKGGTIK